MLTGDNICAAEAVSQKLDLDAVHADLLPEDKVRVFESIQNQHKEGGKIAFVGDGINDAPVLARADVGLAMGGLGSDAAIETADRFRSRWSRWVPRLGIDDTSQITALGDG